MARFASFLYPHSANSILEISLFAVAVLRAFGPSNRSAIGGMWQALVADQIQVTPPIFVLGHVL